MPVTPSNVLAPMFSRCGTLSNAASPLLELAVALGAALKQPLSQGISELRYRRPRLRALFSYQCWDETQRV